MSATLSRKRDTAPATGPLQWAEPMAGGAVVAPPYVLTTAIFDGSERNGQVSDGVHTHTDALLVWPHLGPMTLHTRTAVHHLVPGRGIWVPPGTPHASDPSTGGVSCYTYVAPEAIPPDWSSLRPLKVGRALQEMLLHLDATPMPDDLRLRTQHVIIDMLEEDPHAVIEVPVPEDRRIRALADAVMRDPESDLSLEEWAARHALSARTVARAFGQDVGMSFTRWRSLVRMSRAAGLLARGHQVGLVAHRCGYATTSAFSAAFRRVTGVSPTEFLRERIASMSD